MCGVRVPIATTCSTTGISLGGIQNTRAWPGVGSYILNSGLEVAYSQSAELHRSNSPYLHDNEHIILRGELHLITFLRGLSILIALELDLKLNYTFVNKKSVCVTFKQNAPNHEIYLISINLFYIIIFFGILQLHARLYFYKAIGKLFGTRKIQPYG